jgi:hypothetical protein
MGRLRKGATADRHATDWAAINRPVCRQALNLPGPYRAGPVNTIGPARRPVAATVRGMTGTPVGPFGRARTNEGTMGAIGLLVPYSTISHEGLPPCFCSWST